MAVSVRVAVAPAAAAQAGHAVQADTIAGPRLSRTVVRFRHSSVRGRFPVSLPPDKGIALRRGRRHRSDEARGSFVLTH